MDDAARGPLGSVTMLFSWTTMSLCSVGAIIVIVALTFDPFIQQVVNYPLQDVGVTSVTDTLCSLWPAMFLSGSG